MLHALAIPLLLLQLTAQALASPVAASSPNSSPDGSLFADSSVASSQNPSSQNASTVIRHPVGRSPITLFIQTTPSETIARTDLVTALYNSRDYISSQAKKYGQKTLLDGDDPFNSYPHAEVKCVLVAQTGPAQQMTYTDLGSVVQGLMDVTFYPFKPTVNGVTFAIYHAARGFIGTGALLDTNF